MERIPWHLIGLSSCHHPQERERIRKAATVVLRQQNNVHNATRGAVRQAHTNASVRANTGNKMPPANSTKNNLPQASAPATSGDQVVKSSQVKRLPEPGSEELEGQASKQACCEGD